MKSFRLACALLLAVFAVVEASSVGTSAYALIKNNGSALPRRQTINCTGAGITCSDVAGETEINVSGGGGGGFYQTVQQAGVSLPQEAILNFASGVTCVDNAGVSTDCTATGGGGGGVTFSGVRFSGDSGTSWYGPAFRLFTPPSVGSLTWFNQGSATAALTNGTLFLSTPSASGTNIRGLVETMPSRPFSFIVGYELGPMIDQFQQGGIVLRESGSGKLAFFSVFCCVNDTVRIIIQLYTDANTYASSEVFGATGKPFTMQGNMVWLRWDLEAGGGNRIPMLSPNGIDWTTPGGTIPAWNSFLTPDQVGIAVESQGTGITPSAISVISYSH